MQRVVYEVPIEDQWLPVDGYFLRPLGPRHETIEVTDEWWEAHKDLPREELNAKLGEIYNKP